MFNLTKLRLLWDKVAGLEKSNAAIAPLIPKIPNDYSTAETDTGLKWIDGKSVYIKVFSGTHGQSAGSETLIEGVDTLITAYGVIKDGNIIRAISGSDYFSASKHVYFLKDANNNASVNITSDFALADYSYVLEYTKIAHTRDDETKTTKKKTTKK